MSSSPAVGSTGVLRRLLLPLLIVLLLLVALAPVVAAADPTPIGSPVLIDPLDPRTGDEASVVGAPLTALLFVVGAGLIAVVLTFAYIRLSRRSQRAG